jgi:hypothetical protein
MPEESQNSGKEIIPINKITEPEVFKMYLELGMERSLVKLSKLLNTSDVKYFQLVYWSRTNKWVLKAEEYDKKLHEQAMQLALKNALKSKIDILRICQKVFNRFEQVLEGDKLVLTKRKKDGTVEEEIKINRYSPNMFDVERAYNIVKTELGEGLPEWEKVKEINLTAIFQQIFNQKKSDGESNTIESAPVDEGELK